MRLLSSVLFITSALLSGASVAGAATHRWDASSGLLPTQIAVPWTAIDTAAADPSLAGGVLTLATVSSAENMGY